MIYQLLMNLNEPFDLPRKPRTGPKRRFTFAIALHTWVSAGGRNFSRVLLINQRLRATLQEKLLSPRFPPIFPTEKSLSRLQLAQSSLNFHSAFKWAKCEGKAKASARLATIFCCMYKVFRLPGGSGENPGPGKSSQTNRRMGEKKTFRAFQIVR